MRLVCVGLLGLVLTGCSCHLDQLWSGSGGAGAPTAELAFTTGPKDVPAGSVMDPALVVTALDAAGDLVTSFDSPVTLTIATNQAGAKLLATAQATPVNGVATFRDVRLDKAGSGYRLVASAASAASDTSDPFAVTPGPATTLAFSVQPHNTTEGDALNPAPVLSASDDWGNVVTAFNGTLTLAIGTNGGTRDQGRLMGPNAVKASKGVAQFTGVAIDQAGPGYTLVGAFGGGGTQGTVESAKFDVMDRLPTQLVFSAGPSNTPVSATIAPAVTVAAVDNSGQTAHGYTGLVTIALANNPGNAGLSGTLRVNAVAGVATFADLSVTDAAPGYTLRATADRLGGATSDPFDVTPVPVRLVFYTQPHAANHNQTIVPPVTVVAVDKNGILVAGFTGTVSLAFGANPGGPGSHLNGHTSVTAVLGIATFGDLSVSKAGNNYTLVASAGGLAAAVSAPFSIR